MGFISRKMIPAYDSMCVCCPALRSSSRQPVKRYKKLLAEIFPKSQNAHVNERKIVKLCEYAAKNPLRIPKIAKYLEQRCFKELRCEHIKIVNIVVETYARLLYSCKVQMAYFSSSVLNVVNELLEDSKRDAVHILGCQMLTSFIYSQVDGTFTCSIEKSVRQICDFAHQTGEEHETCCLRAASLQCLSAMLWFMAEFSHIFADFDKIVKAVLDNYNLDTTDEEDAEVASHHNWVDEILRSEGRSGGGSETNPSSLIIRPRPEKRDPSHLIREEMETPRVWVQICTQRMVELAKESTTMRRILDPIFVHFDKGRHWVPQHGLAIMVLSDMCYFTESPGNQEVILSSVIHHLDHKSISHDPQIKSNVIQVAASLTRQIRSGAVISNVGFVSDLCRHLRKSFQLTISTIGSVREEELNLNISLQNAIKICLMETAMGIADPRQLCDIIVVILDELSSAEVVARATIGSLIILAHVISVASSFSSSQQVFPEALLAGLLKAMVHPDVEVRVGAHQIFSALLSPSSSHQTTNIFSQPKKAHSSSASIAALLERLRTENGGNEQQRKEDESREISINDKKWKQGQTIKNSPNFHNISSILDMKACSTSLAEAESSIMRFSEDQIIQLLSAYWVQINQPDNLPSNIEVIAHSYCLTLIYSRMKRPRDNLVIRFFQLPLSLRNLAVDPNNASWSPAYQKLVLVLSTAMLMFAAKLCQIPTLKDLLMSTIRFDADSYFDIGDDFQLYMKPRADLSGYGSVDDNQKEMLFISGLRKTICESDKMLMSILIENLSSIVELEGDDLVKQLSEPFIPEDSFVYDPNSFFNSNPFQANVNSRENLSYDGDFMSNSPVEDDVVSESSGADLPHVVGVGQLLESALVVAGQVAGMSVSASPLPYNTMASQCEALGTCSRQKLSTWLIHERNNKKTSENVFLSSLVNDIPDAAQVSHGGQCAQAAMPPMDPWLAVRLPPASPFDNFLRAARF